MKNTNNLIPADFTNYEYSYYSECEVIHVDFGTKTVLARVNFDEDGIPTVPKKHKKVLKGAS